MMTITNETLKDMIDIYDNVKIKAICQELLGARAKVDWLVDDLRDAREAIRTITATDSARIAELESQISSLEVRSAEDALRQIGKV